jgi:hypothetical protein
MAWNVEREIFKDFLKNIQRFSEKYSDVPAPRVGAPAAETKSDARPVTPF